MSFRSPVPVLLVDDRPENLLALEALLADMDLDLVRATSGNEALKLTLKTEFAAVLLDVQMPDMDGFETAALLRANPKTRRLPIVFVTAGMKDDLSRLRGYETGAVDYLLKPIEPAVLRGKVRVLCDLFLQRKELEHRERLLENLVEDRTQALREREANYRAVLENASDFVMRYDRRGAHLYGNRHAIAFCGLRPDQFIGKTHRELGFPEPLCKLWEEALEAVFTSGESQTVSFDIQTPEGLRVLELKLSPELDVDGHVRSVVGLSRDVTERQTLENVRQFLAQAGWVNAQEPFFSALSRYLAHTLVMDYVCIDRLDGAALEATTLAVFVDGKVGPNVTYSLKDTPCGQVVANSICCIPQGVAKAFPSDQVLQDMGAEGYLGTTLRSTQGLPIGLIALISRKPLPHPDLARKVLELVSIRAAGELERQLTENRWRQLYQAVEQSPVTIVITGLDGTIHYVNPRFTELTGYTREDVVGMNPRVLKSGENSPESYRDLWETILSGRTWVGLFHNKKKDGSLFWEQASISPIRDESGTITHFVAVKEDITAKREAEAGFQRMTDLLNEAGAIAQIGGWEVDLLESKLYWTLETFRIHDLDPETYQPTVETALSFYAPDSRPIITQAVTDAMNLGQGWDLELELDTAKGRRIQVHTTGKAVFQDGRPVRLVGAFRDITQAKRLAAERRQLEQEIQHAQKLESLGSLAGGIAHDMNNVLAAILGMASALKVKYKEDEVLLKALDTIFSASERGKNLVKGLTDFARKGVESAQSISLNDLVTQEVDILRRTTLEKIEFLLDLEADLPRTFGEPSSLSNALMNVSVNAIQAMPQGGTLAFRTRSAEGWVELSVSDSGEGMPPEVLARATDPFFTTKPFGQGTGLGLSIVYGTMKAHGGTLDIQSTVGLGTTLRLRLPALHVPESAQAVHHAAAPSVPAQSVLLVDDDPLIREAIPPMLEALGHHVRVAGSGQEALAFLEQHGEVDLVIMDHAMPGMTGAATLRQIRRLHPDLPLLLATGYVDAEVKTLRAELPDIMLLSKPYAPEEIQRVILANHLARSAQ